MKLLNKALCITAFFAIGSVSAKSVGRGARPATASGAPAGRPVVAPAAQTYKQLHDQIIGMRSGVFAGDKLSDTFINDMAQKAKNADLGAIGFNALLQTARDKLAPFTGKDDIDGDILENINAQISTAVNRF